MTEAIFSYLRPVLQNNLQGLPPRAQGVRLFGKMKKETTIRSGARIHNPPLIRNQTKTSAHIAVGVKKLFFCLKRAVNNKFCTVITNQ